jgi:ubiquinone/menaquinone biosynthesis C-methylase UbiE
MPLLPHEWHARYTLQSGWTKSLRRYLFERGQAWSAKNILDVGCGTGALEADAAETLPGFAGSITGLDISLETLVYAKFTETPASWVQGDALRLPFRSGQFDLVFCHFLLLWVQDPLQVLGEMSRVVRPGGFVLALAEPDYGGRLDFPPEMEVIGSWQEASLRRQGANPWIGRRLGWLLRHTGLEQVENGVLGAQWRGTPSREEIESEWSVLHNDLEQLLGSEQESHWQAEFEKLKRLDETSWRQGERLLFVPTFYAIGKKPL